MGAEWGWVDFELGRTRGQMQNRRVESEIRDANPFNPRIRSVQYSGSRYSSQRRYLERPRKLLD